MHHYISGIVDLNISITHGRFSDPYFKVLLKGGKTKFLDFFSYGHPQQKGLQGQEFSGMGAS